MSHQSDTCLGVREQRRATHRIAQRRERSRRRLHKGQTLVIFVLSFTVLLGLAGLTIDVARAYDLYGRMQRAAEAGALAGVLYMPLNYTANYSDGNNAVKRALQETVKNGFGASVLAGLPATLTTSYFNCPNPSASFEVAVCQSPTNASDLQVYVTQTLNLVLLNGLGVRPITLRAVAQADYVPPVQIAARQNYVGDRIECSPGNSENTNSSYCAAVQSGGNTNRLQYFFAAMDGPSQLQESGDPHVYCTEGPSQIKAGTGLDDDKNAGSDSITTYNGYKTDHQQYINTRDASISQYCGKPSPGGNPGNPDYQPDGYSSTATASSVHPGGYNYQMNIQAGTGNVNLWIYNPFFTPGVSNGPDYFMDNAPSTPSDFYRGPSGDGILNFNGHYDSPYFYFATVVTVYNMPSLYDRTGDTLYNNNAQEIFYPLDAEPNDLALHNCASGQVLDVMGAYSGDSGLVNNNSYHGGVVPNVGCVTPSAANGLACAAATSSTLSNWCKMTVGGSPVSLLDGTGNASGFSTYRVVVEAVGLGSSFLCPNKCTGAATNAADPRGYDYNVTATSGFGQHDYALKACLTSATGAYGTTGCGIGAKGAGKYNQPYVTFYGINNADESFTQVLGTASPNKNYPQTSCITTNTTPYACSDLACIPTSFAGRTITLRIYDPGDAPTGDIYLAIVPPDPTTATLSYTAAYPSPSTTIETATFDGDLAIHTRFNAAYAGYRPFNGLWLNVAITFKPNYVGDCALSTDLANAPGWWQLAWLSSNGPKAGNPQVDSMTISFTTIGSPQHLVAVH